MAGIPEVGTWTKSFLDSPDADFVQLIIYWLGTKNACNLVKLICLLYI